MAFVIGLRCTTCSTSYSISNDTRAPVQCPKCGYKTLAGELGSQFFNAGNEQAAKGDFKQAIDLYTIAIGHNAQDKDAYNNRGLCYGSLGNHQQAIQNYDEALRIDPAYEDARFNRGLALRGERP